MFYRSTVTGDILRGCDVNLICRECGEHMRSKYTAEPPVTIFELIARGHSGYAVTMYKDLHPGVNLRTAYDKVNLIKEDMERRRKRV